MEEGRLGHALKWCEKKNYEFSERLKPALGWCEDNKERINEKPYEWYAKNKGRINKYQKEYRNKSIKNLLTARMRSLINNSARHLNKNIITERIPLKCLNYNIFDLIKRLKKTMPEGYTWQDFLEGKLDIDHIKPAILFNYKSIKDKEFQECWGLNNLRLLTVYENRSRRLIP